MPCLLLQIVLICGSSHRARRAYIEFTWPACSWSSMLIVDSKVLDAQASLLPKCWPHQVSLHLYDTPTGLKDAHQSCHEVAEICTSFPGPPRLLAEPTAHLHWLCDLCQVIAARLGVAVTCLQSLPSIAASNTLASMPLIMQRSEQ